VRAWVRVMMVGAAAALAVAGPAGPALAHVEVSADKNRAGATDVTLTFTGEAENPHAGIRLERVVLPEGIAPADVTLVEAPAGWSFTRTSDGFTVGGKALKVGTDAVWSVRVARLPADATRLSFKTLETYGDGQIVRWIEIQEPGQPEPDNPAPLLTLEPAAPAAASPSGAAPSSAPSSAPAPAPAASDASAAAAEAAVADRVSPTWWIWPAVIVVLVAGAGLLLIRRRASRSG
jgi:Domain of unkown function (DUF1775)